MGALIIQYGSIVIAAITAMVSLWFAAKTKGEANAKVKAAEQRTADQEEMKVNELKRMEAQHATEVKTLETTNEVITDINAMSDNDVLAELRRDYTDK